MMNNIPVKVEIVAVGEKMKHALVMFFERVCKNGYKLVDDKGEIVIADLDNYEERTLLLEFRKKYPQLPAVFFSIRDTQTVDLNNATLLKKPLNLNLLKKTLDGIINTSILNKSQQLDEKNLSENKSKPGDRRKLREGEKWKQPENRKAYSADLSVEATKTILDQKQNKNQPHDAALTMTQYADHAYIGSSQDIDPFDAEAVKVASFHQDNFLHGHLYRFSREVNLKKDEKGILQLSIDKGVFAFSSDGKSIKTNFNEAQLRVVSGVPVVWDKSKISRLTQKWEDIAGTIMNTEQTLWKTSLWASRGRIPSGTNLEAPVCLRFWPNMTRLLIFPHALRIAALWSQRSMSLIDTAIYLGVPQRYVFSFFTATQAIGASYTIKSSPANVDEPKQSHQNSGLFSRIVKHLKSKHEQEQN